jgi:hypothetical protein
MRKKYIKPEPQLRDTLRRWFKGDHPFRDSIRIENFASYISQRDWRDGDPKMPCGCAAALSCARTLNFGPNDLGVAICHSIAYVAVECPTSPTGWEVLRFYIQKTSYKTGVLRPHSQWDSTGGGAMPGMWIYFVAPSRARRLDARRAYQAKIRATPRKKHVKRARVTHHVLPRGYQLWWKSYQQQQLTVETK